LGSKTAKTLHKIAEWYGRQSFYRRG